MRPATKEEIASGKRAYTFVIEGTDAALAKNADLSAAIVLKVYGKDANPEDYTVSVTAPKNNQVGTITIKSVKNGKYTGSKKVKFKYVKNEQDMIQ